MAALLRRTRQGQSMVEFAIMAPMFFLLLLGTIDLGRAVYTYNSISDAAREGARTAVPFDCENQTGLNCPVVQAVTSKLGGGFSLVVDPCVTTRTPSNNACPTDNTSTANPPSNTGYIWISPNIGQTGHQQVTVKITFEFQPWIPVVRDAAGQGVALTAESTMVTEY